MTKVGPLKSHVKGLVVLGSAAILVFVSLAISSCFINSGLESGSTMIDAARGGQAHSADGRVMIDIPEGALAQDTEITIRRVPRAQWPAQVAQNEPFSDVYELLPEGLRFSTPARFELSFDHDVAARGSAPMLTGWSLSADGNLEPLDNVATDYYLANGMARFSADLDHFSLKFATMGSLELAGNMVAQVGGQDVTEYFVNENWQGVTWVRNLGKRIAGDPTAHDYLTLHIAGVGRVRPAKALQESITLVPGASKGFEGHWKCGLVPGRGSPGFHLVHVHTYPQYSRSFSEVVSIWDTVSCLSILGEETGETDGGTDPSDDDAGVGDAGEEEEEAGVGDAGEEEEEAGIDGGDEEVGMGDGGDGGDEEAGVDGGDGDAGMGDGGEEDPDADSTDDGGTPIFPPCDDGMYCSACCEEHYGINYGTYLSCFDYCEGLEPDSDDVINADLEEGFPPCNDGMYCSSCCEEHYFTSARRYNACFEYCEGW